MGDDGGERGARRAALRFAARINVYTIGLAALWNTMNTIVLPDRVGDAVSGSLRGTALGAIGFAGIAIGVLAQPLAGRASDRAPWDDRRRPFILGGTLLDAAALALFWWAPEFWWLLLAYMLLQAASNTAQAAFQALIPDLVAASERGLASGVKVGFDVLGAAVGLAGVALLLQLDVGQGGVLVYLALVIGLCALLNWRWTPVRPRPARDDGPGIVPTQASVLGAFAGLLTARATFRRALATRFLFFLGIYPIQRLFVFYLEDRFGITKLGGVTFAVLGAILLGAVAAGLAGNSSDRVGRRPLLYAGIGLAAGGTLAIAVAPWLALVAIAGACLAVGFGIFQAVNWALLSDDIPPGEGAKYLGLATAVTAAASAGASLFGPLVDLCRAVAPGGAYHLTFSLAALVALAALIPLGRISGAPAGDATTPDRERDFAPLPATPEGSP